MDLHPPESFPSESERVHRFEKTVMMGFGREDNGLPIAETRYLGNPSLCHVRGRGEVGLDGTFWAEPSFCFLENRLDGFQRIRINPAWQPEFLPHLMHHPRKHGDRAGNPERLNIGNC